MLEMYFENLRMTQPLSNAFIQIEESMIEAMKSSKEIEKKEEDVH